MVKANTLIILQWESLTWELLEKLKIWIVSNNLLIPLEAMLTKKNGAHKQMVEKRGLKNLGVR